MMPRLASPVAPRAALAVLARAALPSTVLLALAAAPGAAQSTGGTLTFTGVADATELGSPGVLLEFGTQVRVDPTGNTGIFSHLNNNGRGAAGAMEAFTVGNGPQQVSRVLHIGGYSFDLSFLPSGPYGQDDCYVAPAVGQRCTPFQLPGYELSPFYLENAAAGGSDAMLTAIVKFDVAGTMTGHGQSHDFTGTITALFEGISYQEALMGLEEFGLRGVPFTGTFVVGAQGAGAQGAGAMPLGSANATVTPEPGTVALMATGLAALAALAQRRRRLRASVRA